MEVAHGNEHWENCVRVDHEVYLQDTNQEIPSRTAQKQQSQQQQWWTQKKMLE